MEIPVAPTVGQRFAAFGEQIGSGGDAIPGDVRLKAKLCLLDFLSCAFESRTQPWCRQALEFARMQGGSAATIIGSPIRAGVAEASFANATLGQGLIREDMHPPSTSHLGIIVIPSVLALAEAYGAGGDRILAAIVAGYELSGRLGRALVDPDVARRFRPTTLVGAVGGALAGSVARGLDPHGSAAAIGIAANTVGGLNQWAFAGSTELFLQAGFAARNAVTAVELAALGARAAVDSIDGQGGLLAAFGQSDQSRSMDPTADGRFEISAAYHKPVPACNFVQTACQAALIALSREAMDSRAVAAIAVRSFPAALRYPGCDSIGPFANALQAKMSIQYSVAAAIVRGEAVENNYHLRDDAEIMRLCAATALELDDEFSAMFPSRQGAEVILHLRDGRMRSARLDDLQPCSADDVRRRFRSAAEAAVGAEAAAEIEETIDRFESVADSRPFLGRLGLQAKR